MLKDRVGKKNYLKPIFHLATLFARREAKTRIRQRDWLKLAGEKIRRKQVGRVPTFFVCSREQSRQVENRLKFLLNYRTMPHTTTKVAPSCTAVI